MIWSCPNVGTFIIHCIHATGKTNHLHLKKIIWISFQWHSLTGWTTFTFLGQSVHRDIFVFIFLFCIFSCCCGSYKWLCPKQLQRSALVYYADEFWSHLQLPTPRWWWEGGEEGERGVATCWHVAATKKNNTLTSTSTWTWSSLSHRTVSLSLRVPVAATVSVSILVPANVSVNVSVSVPNSCHVEVDSAGCPTAASSFVWLTEKHFHFSFHLIIHISFAAAASIVSQLLLLSLFMSLL